MKRKEDKKKDILKSKILMNVIKERKGIKFEEKVNKEGLKKKDKRKWIWEKVVLECRVKLNKK